MKGKLYLIPTLIAENTQQEVISPRILETVKSLNYFLCENVRTARRFVSSLHLFPSIEALTFEVLDKDTAHDALPSLLSPLLEGKDIGVLSESGCPGIADPGALAVSYAHQNQIKVVPLVGPSSLLLAIMASGLNGQQFAFHGYVPVEADEAAIVVRKLEKESREKHQTQVFIETPYRNNALLGHLLKCLHDNTRLCIASDLTSQNEKIMSLEVGKWKKLAHKLDKVPTVFLFLAS